MTLLYIDDDVEDLAVFCEAIKTLGPDYTCVMTNNADEALSLVTALHPAMVFLDINMPKTDGVQVLKTIRLDNTLRAVKVCILSTSITDTETVNYLSMGANYCLRKQNSFEELKHDLKVLLEQSHCEND